MRRTRVWAPPAPCRRAATPPRHRPATAPDRERRPLPGTARARPRHRPTQARARPRPPRVSEQRRVAGQPRAHPRPIPAAHGSHGPRQPRPTRPWVHAGLGAGMPPHSADHPPQPPTGTPSETTTGRITRTRPPTRLSTASGVSGGVPAMSTTLPPNRVGRAGRQTPDRQNGKLSRRAGTRPKIGTKSQFHSSRPNGKRVRCAQRARVEPGGHGEPETAGTSKAAHAARAVPLRRSTLGIDPPPRRDRRDHPGASSIPFCWQCSKLRGHVRSGPAGCSRRSAR